MPLPLPMMIPFMGIQSGVMALMFGQNFQFGKRKISAMSNEEFNELTFEKLMQQNLGTLKSLIPTFEKSLADMRPFTEFIIREFGVMITQLIGQTGNQFDKATQTAQDDFYHFMGWGHAPTSYHQDGTLHEGATETLPPPPEEPPTEPPEEPPTEPPTENNHLIETQFVFSLVDPIGSQTISYASPRTALAGHMTEFTNLLNDNSSMEGSGAGKSQLLAEYRNRINAYYDDGPHV